MWDSVNNQLDRSSITTLTNVFAWLYKSKKKMMMGAWSHAPAASQHDNIIEMHGSPSYHMTRPFLTNSDDANLT